MLDFFGHLIAFFIGGGKCVSCNFICFGGSEETICSIFGFFVFCQEVHLQIFPSSMCILFKTKVLSPFLVFSDLLSTEITKNWGKYYFLRLYYKNYYCWNKKAIPEHFCKKKSQKNYTHNKLMFKILKFKKCLSKDNDRKYKLE